MSNNLVDLPELEAVDLVSDCYKELSRYTARTRNYASVYDGFKAVYRRVVYASLKYTSKVKSAAIVGDSMKLHPHGDCLRGDTNLYLLDGTEITMEEWYNQGGELEILAVDSSSGNLVPSVAHSVRIGQYTDKIYRITLSNGGCVEVTSNHPFLLDSLEWRKAGELVVGEKLYSQRINDGVRPKLSSKEFRQYLDNYYLDSACIIKIEVCEVDSEPMFDFTVDDLENMIIPVGEDSSGNKLLISVHNSSIYDALVSSACKFGRFPIFDTKGNFGGQGQPYAAMRYTEACLSDIGRLLYGELIDYADYVEGDAGEWEPEYIPALLPYCLLTGTSAIPTGLPTPKIPPLNAIQLVDYYISYLEGNPMSNYPKIDLGGILIDGYQDSINELLSTGRGRIWYKGIIHQESDNRIVVTTETPGCNFGNLQKAVQGYLDQELIDYSDESDGSGDRHVFVINDLSKLSADKLKSILDNKLNCSVTYAMYFEDKSNVVLSNLDYIVYSSVSYLKKCSIRKFQDLFDKANRKLQVARALEDYKSSGEFTKMPSLSSEEVSEFIINELGYPDWVANGVLDKGMRYLTKDHSSDIIDLEAECSRYQKLIDDPTDYLLELYRELRLKVGEFYSTREHSITLEEYESRVPMTAKLESGELVVSPDSNGISWNRTIYLVHSDGTITSSYVDNIAEKRIEVPEDVVAIGSDKGGNYLSVLLNDEFIFTKELSELSGSRRRFKTWDGLEVTKVITSSSNLELTSTSGSKYMINLEEYTKTRLSNPVKLPSKLS